MSAPPPGWYPDPWRRAPLRWWDGTTWTGYTADATQVVPARLVDPAAWLPRERRLTPWLRFALFVWPLVTAVSLGAMVITLQHLTDVVRGRQVSLTFWWPGQLGGPLSLLLLVLRILWLYRAAQVARGLGFDLRREPLAMALGWLIPVLNYWWPFQGMTDLFPEGQRPDRRIAWWWGTSIVSALGFLPVFLVPFVPRWVAVVLVLVLLVPTVVAAALEVGLVGDALALHERLVER